MIHCNNKHTHTQNTFVFFLEMKSLFSYVFVFGFGNSFRKHVVVMRMEKKNLSLSLSLIFISNLLFVLIHHFFIHIEKIVAASASVITWWIELRKWSPLSTVFFFLTGLFENRVFSFFLFFCFCSWKKTYYNSG